MTTDQQVYEYVNLLECDRCPDEKFKQVHGRRLCPECRDDVRKFIAELLIAKANGASLLTIAKETNQALKYIVAHIDKLELANTVFSKGERKDE